MEFTDKQKLVIAEFAHAYETDTLIKSEAEDLIKVFQEHNISKAFTTNVDINDCLELLFENTTLEERDLIMQSYYSGSL
jgi:hypothetical protein